ncbi:MULTISPECIES: DUF7352 domain-containing protein [Bacillus amyloliquefaciens group]|uniref:DUF7352 domain-containing protein n=1 Tax=Bacillus amyloliquefaciens group TaxID=1938374 RepID=UPI00073CC891|nr:MULTISPECIES: hypothetical protein [Bacillus amyloliquefaciens group]KTF59883.1 hypothetical protein AR691_14230 [Bacillus amyloliquefaciens]
MYCVWKYKLDSMVQKIHLPVGSKVLSASARDDDVVIYALVNRDELKKEIREFVVQPTGESTLENLNTFMFLSTVVFPSGLVFHIFYK